MLTVETDDDAIIRRFEATELEGMVAEIRDTLMRQIPQDFLTKTRATDPNFEPTEQLYRRFEPDHIEEDTSIRGRLSCRIFL